MKQKKIFNDTEYEIFLLDMKETYLPKFGLLDLNGIKFIVNALVKIYNTDIIKRKEISDYWLDKYDVYINGTLDDLDHDVWELCDLYNIEYDKKISHNVFDDYNIKILIDRIKWCLKDWKGVINNFELSELTDLVKPVEFKKNDVIYFLDFSLDVDKMENRFLNLNNESNVALFNPILNILIIKNNNER